MKRRLILLLAASAAIGVAAQAQGDRRQATMVGGGSPDGGKCTIEIRVDKVSEVEIRGTSATLRTTDGQPAQWRRFECTSPMPANPANFRFAGVDGRGRQTLIRDPRNGGVAVVRIEDPDNGTEGYTFDLFWGGGIAPSQGNYQRNDRVEDRRPDYGEDRYRPGWRDGEYNRRYGHGFAVDEAIRICQDSVAQQARERFRNADVHFGPTRIDDNPGRNDWVIGSIDVHRRGRDDRFDREERFGFACSVDFNSGRVRSAQINDRPMGGR